MINLCGPEGFVKERLAAFAEAGVTVLNIIPVGGDPIRTIETLKDLDRLTHRGSAWSGQRDGVSHGGAWVRVSAGRTTRSRTASASATNGRTRSPAGTELVDGADALAGGHELPVGVDARCARRRAEVVGAVARSTASTWAGNGSSSSGCSLEVAACSRCAPPGRSCR